MRYYRAVVADHGSTSSYELFDTVVLAKPRRDTQSTQLARRMCTASRFSRRTGESM